MSEPDHLDARNTASHALRRAFAACPAHRFGDQPGCAPADVPDRERVLGAGDNPEPDCGLGIVCMGLPHQLGYWRHREKPAGVLDALHHHICLLGGHQPCWNDDLGCAATAQGRLAASDHTGRRSNDCFRADDGRHCTLLSTWAGSGSSIG